MLSTIVPSFSVSMANRNFELGYYCIRRNLASGSIVLVENWIQEDCTWSNLTAADLDLSCIHIQCACLDTIQVCPMLEWFMLLFLNDICRMKDIGMVFMILCRSSWLALGYLSKAHHLLKSLIYMSMLFGLKDLNTHSIIGLCSAAIYRCVGFTSAGVRDLFSPCDLGTPGTCRIAPSFGSLSDGMLSLPFPGWVVSSEME